LQPTVLLLTPPFTQLNTPYPATAYLKGFLNTRQIASFQADLGIEVILALFSREGLTRLFAHIGGSTSAMSDNAQRMIALQDHYIQTIDSVILFLQGKNPTVSHSNAFLTFLDFFLDGFVASGVAKVVYVFELCAHSEHKCNQSRS
jgi:hypothetical protein